MSDSSPVTPSRSLLQIEKYYADHSTGTYFVADKILCHEYSPYQEVLIYDNKLFERVLSIDGILQTTLRDEFIYHELMVHTPSMQLFQEHSVYAENVLVIGGGDGGSIEEFCKYPSIQNIHMTEIDQVVIDLCQKYLPSISADAFQDSRVQLYVQDAAQWIKQAPDNFYDIIVADSTDPINVGAALFTPQFYQQCARVMKKHGIFVNHFGTYFIPYRQVIPEILANITDSFPHYALYRGTIPTYAGGEMMFALSSKLPLNNTNNISLISEYFQKIQLNTSFYQPSLHPSLFAMPRFISSLIQEN